MHGLAYPFFEQGNGWNMKSFVSHMLGMCAKFPQSKISDKW